MADNKYLQNQRLAFDLLKKEGYTDIGDSAEALFKNRKNSEIAYDLLKKAGYTDIGKDYNEFAGLLYEPATSSESQYDPYETSSLSDAPGRARRYMRREEKASENRPTESDTPATEPAAPVNLTATSRLSQAPESTKAYLANPLVGKSTEELSAMMGELNDSEGLFAKEYERRNKAQTELARESDIAPEVDPAEIAWLKENSERYNAYKDKREKIADAFAHTTEYADILDANKEAENLAKEHTGAQAVIAQRLSPLNDEETKNWDAVRQLSHLTDKEARLGDKSAFTGEPDKDIVTAVTQFGSAALNNVDIDTITMGLASASAFMDARKIGEKYNRIVNEVMKSVPPGEDPTVAIYEALDNGLSESEIEVLKALDRYTYVTGIKASTASTAAKAGQAAEQSAEFMFDFLLTGGLAKGGAKTASKIMRGWVKQKAGRKGLTNVLGNMPEAMAKLSAKGIKPSLGATMLADMGVAAERTALMFPRNLNTYGEQLLQMGERGERGQYNFSRSKANAALNTALTQYIEYWSEGFGEYFGAGEKALFQWATKRAPSTLIGQTLSSYRGSIGKFLDYGKFNGMFNEMLEEAVGSTFNALNGWLSGDRVGDSEALKEFIAGDNLATLFFSFLPMSAISARTNIRAYNKMRERYDASVDALNPYLASGAISSEELDDLTGSIENSTPEQLKDRVVSLADKARKKNGGRLPENFAQSLMGYVEGALSMRMQSDVWDNSAQKREVVDAYADAYVNRQASDAWDAEHNEQVAHDAAIAAGFSEEQLDNDPYRLAQQAMMLEQSAPEASAALSAYATAKASREGLEEGYKNETSEFIDDYEREIRDNVDNNGTVISADLNGVRVFVTTKDATVNADGTISAGDGNGLVAVRSLDGSATNRAKAGDLLNASSQSTNEYLSQWAEDFSNQRAEYYVQAQSTVSPAGKMEMISGLAGQTILLQAPDGQVLSANIVNVDASTGRATIGIDGGMRVVSMTDLYDMAQKDANGNIALDPATVQAQPAEQPQQPAQPAAPSARSQDLSALLGEDVTITLNGQPTTVNVADVDSGRVYFTYGNTSGSMTEQEFSAAMQGSQSPAPAETETTETRETPAQPETPQSTLPMKNGEVDVDNLFNVDEQTFATRIPELVPFYQQMLGDNALKEVQKAYAAAGEAVKKQQEKIDKNTDLKKAPGLYKTLADLQRDRKNIGALLLAMTPKRETKAPAAQAPATETPAAEGETNVPDISNDTPEAAQKRGYVMQNGNRIDRSADDTVAVEGKDTRISFAKNEVVDAKYGLIDAGRIVPSHVSDQENPLHFFAKKWQPKNRKKADSATAIQQMANGLRPEEITRGATAYVGAPIVNSRGEVIQGNGRSEALRRAYTQGTASDYKAWLAEHADEFGLTREQVESMENPILVRKVDVDDARAEELGQFAAGDLESGGDQTFTARGLAKKLGNKLGDVLNLLFGGELGDDATITDYINANGQTVLSWLRQNGYINDTEQQNAVSIGRDEEPRFTEATVSAFRELSLEPLFANAPEKVRAGYEKLSNIAKLALQKSAANLAGLEGVIADLQEALAYFYDFETADPAFQKAKTVEEAWKAIEDWMMNIQLGSETSEADLHPSLVAKRFAARFKGAKKAKSLTDLFNAIAVAMQGETTLYGTTEATDRIGAYEQTNIISEEEANRLRNGEQDNNERGADDGAGVPGEQRGRGGEGATGSGEEAPAESSATDTGASGETEGTQEEVAEGPKEEPAPAEKIGGTIPEVVEEQVEEVTQDPLTEDEIRNSGYDDPSIIEQAVDYIHGNTGNLLNQVAYQLIEDYVRNKHMGQQSAGGNGQRVSELGSSATGSRGAAGQRSGGEDGQVGEGGSAEGVSGTAGVQPGREGDSNGAVAATGERGNSRRGGLSGSGSSVRGDGGGSSGNRGRGRELHDDGRGKAESGASSRSDESGQNQSRREQLDSEIEDLLGQLGDTLKGFSKPDGTLGVSIVPGMSATQLQALAKAAKLTAQIGYRLLLKGYYTLADYIARLGDTIRDVLKKAGLTDDDVDRFIRDSWDALYTVDGETHRIREWASILKDREFRRMAELSYEEKKKLQKEANERKSKVELADSANIQEQLPFLFQHQIENVVKAEKQFFGEEALSSHERAYGKGMMFTDGTGTGKTYTGLGIIKRFVNQGKKRILLVCPAGKVVDWQKDASNLGLSPEALMTKGKGSGFVVMSYESFRANQDIMEDTFDLVVYDEAHKMMSSVQASPTKALAAHFAITNRNKQQALERIQQNHELWKLERDLNATIEYQEGKLAEGDADAQSIIDKCNGELNQVHEKQQKVLPELEKQAEDAVKRTKVLFLTATPFNNERNMQYADGYIFNSQGTAEQVVKRADTNDGQFESSENDFDYWLEKTFPAKFYISNGKAQERRGNATKLDQEEISWNEHAKELGVLSGQKINIPFDYSRDFPIVSIEHQVDFNSAIEDLRRNPQFSVLQASFPHLVGKSGYGNYNWTSYLWEVMKVSGLKDRIDQHLAMGRKVVIFNRRRYRPGEKVTRAELKKQGMSDEDIEDMLDQQSEMEGLPPMGPPFAAGIERAMLNPDLRVRQAAAAFAVKYASLLQWEKTLDYRPIEEQFMDLYATQEDRKKYAEAHAKWEKAVAEIRNENEKLPKDKRKTYPAEPRLKASGIGLVRGSGEGVTNKSKLKDQDTFNNTDKMNIIIVQESSGKEGISLHDTTGEHQRVLISTALPQSPLTFIQIEGRIYRLGNKSNAIYEYPLLGINLETSQFAGRINTASQTTENLAMGEEARGLRESIKNAVLHRAGIVPLEGQGHGGKDFDQRVRASASSRGFDGAIQDYKESQSQLSEAEKSNADMAITPHPLGYKMAQWAQATEGETFLEPSAGQGILAQYVPGANAMTALETDGGLFTRLSVAIGAANRTLQQKSIREYSPINKHDIVLMHPPVGDQGTEAAEQFIEAAKHLEEGGRLIAVVPQGLEFEDATIRNEGNLLRVDGVDYSWEQFWDKYGILLNNAGGWISTFIARYVSAKDSKSNTLEKMRAQLDEYKDRLSNQAQGSTERAVLEKKIESLSELIGIIEKPSTERIEPGSDTSVYKVLSSDEYRSDFTKVMKGLVKVGEIKLPNFAIAGDIPMKVLVYDQVTRKEAREMVPDAVSYDVSDAKDMDDFFEKIRNLSMPARTVDNLAKIEKVARRFANAVNSIPDILPKGDGAKASVSNGLISVPHRTIKDWEGSYFGKHGATYRLSDIFPFLSNPDGEKIGRSTARWYRTIAERLKLGESEYAQRISRYGDTEVKNAGAIRQFEEALLKFFRDASGLTETQIGRVADGLPAEIGAADLEGTPTAETLKAKFDIANGNDDFRLKMFNKVLDKGEKSGLNITNYKSYGNDAGLYYPSRHSLEINVNVWNRLSNEQRAQVVCHEALHSATTLPLEVNERLSRFDFNSNEEYAAAQRIITPEVKSACDRLENLYRAIQRGEESYKVQGYGLSNSHEMIAELANPKYREALASRSLWIMPDGSFSGFEVPGAKKTDALTEVTAATNALIDSFRAEDYQTARAIINGDSMPSLTRDLALEDLSETDGGLANNNYENNTNFVANEYDSNRTGTSQDAIGEGERNGSDTYGQDARKVEISRDKGRIRVLETEVAPSQREYTDSSDRDYARRVDQYNEGQRLIEAAKANGLFIEPGSYSHLPRVARQSRESVVYHDVENGRAIKIMDPFAAESMSGNSPFDELYRHIIHNIYFPESRYEFLGITTNARGDEVRFVLSQPWIESYERVWDVEADDFVKKHGFGPLDGYKRQNDDAIVFDFYGHNILKDADGNIYLIDPIISFKRDPRAIIDEYLGAESTDEEANADNLLFREETDEDVLERLNSEPTIKVYRAMQLIDGNLYPPMSAKVDGKMREPIAIGKWERAEERPELADNKDNFVLNKGNGSSLKAKYNPYIHTSRTPLNDQFTSAYNRPNLVTVEVEVPESELTSGYKAEKAKDAVGEMTWHSGPVSGKLPEGKKRKVILSRWDKPVRVLPNSEVADRIAELLDGENIAIPYNVVTPELRAELAQRGVRISDSPSGTVKNNTLRSREANTVERRVAVAEYRAVNDTLDTMSEELGIKINRVSRGEMPRGHKRDKGYYNPRTGEMTICMDNVSDLRDAVATVLHETVGHHGLRQLFGASFNDAMRDIYAHLDSKGRRWVHDYMVRHNLQPGDADAIIRGMEEYLSHLAESGDFKNSVWDDIKEILGKLVDAIFGTDGFTFTDNELNYILRASYENLKDPNWLNTAEGRARDILLKRELGINETDPNRPTDPQGPLFRDGENLSARDNYESELQSRWNNIVMEHQDADQPVRLGMDAIMKEVGKTSLDENEDFLTRHNLVSSRAETEAHEFELFHFTPLLEQVREIQNKLMGNRSDKAAREDAYHRTLDYLYAVSALERNEYKNNEVEQQKQDALQAARTSADAQIDAARNSGKSASEISRAIDAIEKRLAKQESDINEAYEGMKKDWSGLTSLMGRPKEEWREAEDDARAMVEAFRSEVNDDAALEELWNRIRSCTDYSLEHAYKYGLLTREEFERLHGTESQPRMWNYYLPLRGFSEETAEDAYSYSNMVHPQTNSVVVKKMNGRWTQADNPLANILNIAETEIVQGNENWAKQALYRFVLNAGENSLLSQRDAWFVKNPADGTWSMAEPEADETLEEFEARMQALRDLDEPLAKKTRKGLKLDRIMANKAHKNEHLIRLKVGGMEKMIWVNGNPAIAQAVTGQNRGKNMRLIRRASRALSNLFTTYSLDFTARNLIRDTIYSQMALIAKEDSAYRWQFRKNWIRNFGYGAFAYPMVRMMAEWESGKLQRKANPTPREQMFMDFMRDGGQTGYTIINSVKDIKDSLERSMRRAGKKVNSVSIPILGHYAKFVKTLNEGFELLTRFTAYQTSRDMGRSGQRAASDAKEISVNFNRRGAQSKGLAAYLGATHYFYNAGVQGFENFLRLFKTAPVKMTVGTGSLVFLAMLTPLLNSALAGLAAGMGDGDGGGDDDWYWNLPEWVRRNNLILGTGSWYLAIPLSVELRAFYGLGDIAASLMYHKATARNGFEIGLDAINTAAGILPVNPIEGYTSNGNIFDAFLRTAAPDATMFIVDIATNRDFTGRPLRKENPFSDTTPRSQSAFASTPKALVEACQWLARETNGGIDLAPGEVRDILKNLGGGFYRAAEDVTKLIYSDEERPRRWDDIPFFSGFTGHLDEDRSNSFASSASYNYKKLSESVVRRINAAAGSSDITAKMVYETPEQLPKSARVQRILEGENYILGKMYREGMNNEYLIKQRKRGSKYGKKGEWYKSKEIARKGVATLKEEWKAMREQYAAMPDKTEEEKAAKAAFLLDVQDAWHKYYDAEANLVDQLMEEEYNHVQQRRKNGIPYEPKTTTSQKVYDFAKELVQ